MGEWLAHCSACPVPEIANVFRWAGIPFYEIKSMLQDDPVAWREIDEWVAAAQAAAGMFEHRLGLMGHYFSGILDSYSDVTLQCATFATHIEHLEVDELTARRASVTESEVRA